mgnify:CR=1 FL=1
MANSFEYEGDLFDELSPEELEKKFDDTLNTLNKTSDAGLRLTLTIQMNAIKALLMD